MAKTKQKVSGTFRTLLHAQAYGHLSSDLKTSANQGVGPLTAIRLALAGARFLTVGKIKPAGLGHESGNNGMTRPPSGA